MAGLLRRLSASLKRLSARLARHEDCNIVIVGLDNSGKSTIINYLAAVSKGDAGVVVAEQVAPTVGFRTEKVVRNRLNITVFDMSGQGKYRNLWEKQYGQVHGIIFVVDATDKMRMCVAKDELELILENTQVRSGGLPILFLANKMDDPSHVSPAECVSRLGLESIRERPWFIIGTSAKTGEGLEPAFDWLAENIVETSEEEKRK